MSWAKFDDRYDDNRKVKKAWRTDMATIGLHAMAITYSSRHETDGVIDLDWLEEKVPAPKVRERIIAALVDADLFEPVDGTHFIVHDYLDYNPSAQSLADKRAKDAERKRQRLARLQADAEAKANGVGVESERSPNGFQRESVSHV